MTSYSPENIFIWLKVNDVQPYSKVVVTVEATHNNTPRQVQGKTNVLPHMCFGFGYINQKNLKEVACVAASVF